MGAPDRDLTDLGLANTPTAEDLAALRAARRRTHVVAGDSTGAEPATAEFRARVLDRTRQGRPRARRIPPRRCVRCNAEPWMWCRTSVRANRKPGFVHPERDAEES